MPREMLVKGRTSSDTKYNLPRCPRLTPGTTFFFKPEYLSVKNQDYLISGNINIF